MTRLKLGADVPAFKIRWRGYDRAEVEDYLRETRLRESMALLDIWSGTGQPSGEDESTPQEVERLMALRRDVANCLLEIGMAAERDGRALLADDPQSEGGGSVDVEAGLRALAPTGDLDQAEPGELLQAARREVERLIGLRRDVANCLLEIGTAAERDGRALLASDPHAGGDVEQITIEKSVDAEAGVGTPAAGSQPPPPAEDAEDLGDVAQTGRSLRRYGVIIFGLLSMSVTLIWLFGGWQDAATVVQVDQQTMNESNVPTAEVVDPASGEPEAVPARGVSETFEAPVESALTSNGLVLTLTARESCWISTLVDGGTPLERLMRPNETIVLHAQKEAFLRVGNAAALSMLINNQQAKPLGADGQVVEMRINHANAPSYLVEPSVRSSGPLGVGAAHVATGDLGPSVLDTHIAFAQ